MPKQFLIAAMFSIALLTRFVRAQDIGGEPGSYAITRDDMLVMLMPEAKNAKAPRWLKPGIRLIWHSASAIVATSYVGGLTQDPDGQWRDPTTGQRFRAEEAATAGGHGFMVLDVIAVHDDVAVISYSMQGIQGVDGPLSILSTGAYTTPAGYLSGYWVNPEVLARHTELAGEGVQSSRTPYECGGRRYDALWSSMKSAGVYNSCVTDLAGGLVLHCGTATSTPANTANLGGVATNVGGGTTLTQTTFRGMRKLQIPWAGAELPPVIANVHKLVYQGTTTVSIPGTFPVSFAYTAQHEITGRGKDFLQGKWSNRMDYGNGMAPAVSSAEAVSGCNQLTPLAIPPEHLARLEQGQVLDRDPVTKIVTSVVFAGRDRRGNDIAVISCSQGEGCYRIDSIYDRASGMLSGIAMTDPTAHSQTQISLTRKE